MTGAGQIQGLVSCTPTLEERDSAAGAGDRGNFVVAADVVVVVGETGVELRSLR